MNILLLSHQLDFSGAPIALLRLAETLINQGHSVSLATRKLGPLGAEFGKIGVKQFNQSLSKQYDLYFANTFLMVPVALNMATSNDKVIAWIHESRSFFDIYKLDANNFGLASLKHAIFPAKFIMEEYRDLMPNCSMTQVRNLVTMNEKAPLPAFEHHFAVTGSWEPRKNQAALINLLFETNLSIKFNFIGANKPATISDTTHNFFGQVPMLKAKELIASSLGLISAAKSETQPLSVIEAILSKNPVLLSDIPAHLELKSLMPDVVLFNPNDASSFRRGYESTFLQKNNPQLLEANKVAAESYFGQSAFDSAIRLLLS
jgi:glycosyltransferase involved in cell wall biosynthesis